MARDKDFHDYILHDVFAGLFGINSRAMFGGYGFYKDGKMFGLIADGKLYFKVGEGNKKDYEEEGSEPFVYRSKDKDVTLNYWELPERLFENKEELVEWIEKSILVHMEK